MIADLTYLPASGDSVMMQLHGDSALIASIGVGETIDVSDGTTHVTLPLASATAAALVWRFVSLDTTTLHVTINRALSSVADGSVTLTASASVAAVASVRPWVAARTGLAAARLSASTVHVPRVLADLSPGCNGGDTPVTGSGTLCGVAVAFSPEPVSADAFTNLGATFQSPPHGHGVSHAMTVSFNPPISSVTITCYDPTFAFNTMTARDANGALVATDTFPGSGVPGLDFPATRTISGSISTVVLTPAAADYVAYSMTIRGAAPTTLTILSATGSSPGGSFTTRTAPSEDVIQLAATVTPSSLQAAVAWQVVDAPSDSGSTIPPQSVPSGANSSFTIPISNRSQSRWPRVHASANADSLKKALSLQITATVSAQGQVVTSQPVTIRQNEIDTMREEYLEFGQDSVPSLSTIGRLGDANRNSGDYTVWVSSSLLLQKMPVMQSLAQAAFGQPITVTSGYRNPVHHLVHVRATAVNSVHLFGGATDWRIFDSPAGLGLTPSQYFDRLKALTKDPTVGGCWEPRATIIQSSLTHTLDHAHTHWSATGCQPGW